MTLRISVENGNFNLPDGKYVMMGSYDTSSGVLDWRNKEKFVGGVPPPDSTIVKESLLTVSIQVLHIRLCIKTIHIHFSSPNSGCF
jgi:gamma-aminobutyric acid type B receptor